MAITDKPRASSFAQPTKPKLRNLFAAATSGELRDSARFKCIGNVEFCIDGSEIRTHAKMTDVSLAGCYVEMTATSAPGTILSLVVAARDIRFKVNGIVRTSDPCLGMGIAFTEISNSDLGYLHRLLLELSEPAAVSPPSVGFLGSDVEDAADKLQAVSKFFQKKSFLTRDEFQAILNRR